MYIHTEPNTKPEKLKKTSKETFEAKGIGLDLPEVQIKKNDLENGIKILDLLSFNKIFSSKSEARRAIKGNALKINNQVLRDEKKILKLNDFKDSKSLKISFGKKKHYIVKIN